MGARPIAYLKRCVPAIRPSAHPPSGRWRGRRHRRLRQFLRRADRRRPRRLPPPAMTAIAWSTPWRSASPGRTPSSTPRPSASACPWSISFQRPAATASTTPPMASAEFGEGATRSARPCRSASPSAEKLLLEACLEGIMAAGCVVAIQDMGAARASPARRWRWAPGATSVSRAFQNLDNVPPAAKRA